MQQLTFESVVPSRTKGRSTGAAAASDLEAATAAQQRSGGWRVSLFGCCAQPLSCLSVVFCDFIAFAQAWSIAQGGNKQMCRVVAVVLLVLMIVGVALSLIAHSATMMAANILNGVLGVVGLVILCVARTMVRRREGIAGSSVGDCAAVVCCGPCVLCQVLNEYPGAGGGYRGLGAPYDPLVLGEKAAVAEEVRDVRAPLAATMA